MGMVTSKISRTLKSLAIKAEDTHSLLSLPKALFVGIFTKWIDLSDLGKLDSALCNTHERKVFSLRIYRNNLILNNTSSSDNPLNVECVSWLEKHQLSTTFLCLNAQSVVPDLFIFYVKCNNVLAKTRGLKLRGSSALLSRIVDSVAHNANMTSFHFMHSIPSTPTFTEIAPVSLNGCGLPINLTTLRITNCDVFTDEVLTALQAKCDRLTEVQLTSCHHASDSVVHTVLQHVGAQLKTLTLNSCKLLTLSSFVHLSALCPALTSLVFFSHRNLTVNVALLAERCPLLERLVLYNVVFSGDIIVTKHHFPRLVEVSVDLFLGGGGGGRGSGGHYVELTHFILACPALKKLELLSRVGLDKKTCQLSCFHQKQLTGMTLLLRGLPVKMHSLSLSLARHVTDTHIATLAVQCPTLCQLVLLSCDQLTDQSLVILAKQCKQLVFLNISHCEGITTSGVLTLLSLSVSLKSLVGVDCNKVDMKEVLKGNKKRVKLRY